MSSRAGSHAGRGFRYQDVVAAHLAVMGFAGRYPYGMVIPEGRDDLELRASEFRVLCQVKSRRDHMGPFSAKSIAGFIKKMWDSTARQPTDRFLLVVPSVEIQGVHRPCSPRSLMLIPATAPGGAWDEVAKI